MTLKIAINGFGRIGRGVLRALIEQDAQDIEVVAINDLAPPKNIAHLLKYDSVHGRLRESVAVEDDTLVVGHRRIRLTALRNPEELPWGDVDVDIRPGLAFDALPALQKEEVDLVVSSDPEDLPGVEFVELFDYNPVFVAASSHPLAEKDFIEAEDFRGQTLITYPVERTRLDVFSQLLIPAKVEPASVRQVELTAVILLLVASNRGVAVLPDWVVREVKYNSDYVTRPLTKDGITRRLYAATRSDDVDKKYVQDLISFAKREAVKLQSA